MLKLTVYLLAAFLNILLVQSAAAQEDEDVDEEFNAFLEEVIVTARKRFEVMQDVPISMAAVTGEKILTNNIQKLEELARYVPNVHVGEAALGNQIYVRGIGSGVNTGFEQTVGSYIDGLYYGRGQPSRAPFFDIERIEMLKGPQGILFGKNTVAGALSVTTTDPTYEWEGYVTAMYEAELKEKNILGAFSGPITESFRARLAVRVSDTDGFLDNTLKGDTEPQYDEKGVRLTVAWDPDLDTEVILKASRIDFEVEGRNNQIERCSPFLLLDLNSLGVDEDCTASDDKASGGEFVFSKSGDSGVDFGEESADYDMEHVSLNIDRAFGDWSFTSLSGFVSYDSEIHSDSDFSALSSLLTVNRELYDQWSQELRLTSPLGETFEYLIGFYYQDTKQDSVSVISANLPRLGILTSIVNDAQMDTETYAFFAQGTWFINDFWRATLGGRYTRESKDIVKTLVAAELGTTIATEDSTTLALLESLLGVYQHRIPAARTETNFSPSLNLKWDLNDDVMMYLAYSRGFKGGGFDQLLTDPNDNIEFEEEEVVAYEAGAKLRLADGAGKLNIAIFLNDFDDVQVSTFDGQAGFSVSNAGETRTQGIEVDGRYRVNYVLTVGGAFAYLDAEYQKFDTGQCYSSQDESTGCVNGFQDLSGRETQFSPDWSVNVNADVYYPLSNDLAFNATIDIQYMDDYAVANDLDPELKQDSFVKTNIRLSISEIDEKMVDCIDRQKPYRRRNLDLGQRHPT